jgi:hypothetical protein
MDLNYILAREQFSLHNASIATSPPARTAHEGLAKAYGALLEHSTFPHRQPIIKATKRATISDVETWEGEGGSIG